MATGSLYMGRELLHRLSGNSDAQEREVGPIQPAGHKLAFLVSVTLWVAQAPVETHLGMSVKDLIKTCKEQTFLVKNDHYNSPLYLALWYLNHLH